MDIGSLRKEGDWEATGKKGMFGLVEKKGIFVRTQGQTTSKKATEETSADFQSGNHKQCSIRAWTVPVP